jgi:hypothetical protein
MIRFPTIWPALYSGPGKLVDHGFLSKVDRFVLDLGVCDLSSAGEYTFRLKRLPPRHLNIGINVVSDSPLFVDLGFKPDVRVSSVVGLEVTNERHETVIAQRCSLDKWTWSHRVSNPNESYLWIEGKSITQEIGNGSSTTTAVEFSPDRGWGTCFVPRFLGEYVVRVSVDTPDPRTESLRAMIRVTGGGL